MIPITPVRVEAGRRRHDRQIPNDIKAAKWHTGDIDELTLARMYMLSMKMIGTAPEEIKNTRDLYYRAFPANERRPFQEMIDHRIEDTDTFCLYDEDTYVGLAVVMYSPDIAHIIYLAMEESLRGQGYGSRALELLHAFYHDKRIMVDIERPEGISENEEQRVSRKQFYLRAGYSETPVKYRWRGEDYEILSFGGNVSEQDFENFWKHFHL